jgi:hypothetical protein
LPVALWGVSPFVCLAVGMLALLLIVRFVGKRATDVAAELNANAL